MTKQHIYPTPDWLPHRTDGEPCPCNPRVEGDVVIHHSWDGREQSEPGSAWVAPEIRLFMDGDQWCALAGADIQQGYAGFGAAPQIALNNLLQGHQEIPLETHEQIWAALEAEEITMSRAAELLGMPFVEVREMFERRG